MGVGGAGRLAHGDRVDGLLRLGDVDPGLGRVEPEEADGRVFLVRLHEGDGAVEGHRAVRLVLKHI